MDLYFSNLKINLTIPEYRELLFHNLASGEDSGLASFRFITRAVVRFVFDVDPSEQEIEILLNASLVRHWRKKKQQNK